MEKKKDILHHENVVVYRECARLQSFPEDFKIAEEDRHSYKQFGNAVNVSNVHTVIKATFDHYDINLNNNQ